jgi:3-hydroxyisobutyrate dehydrogenase
MAGAALRAGVPTVVWNRDPRRAADLGALGATVAATPADAARRADIVVTMVTDADVVMAIARDHGMLAALTPGAIWVQMSTIGVAGIERVKSFVETERSDVILVDAPVSGSKGPAEKGELSIFASGPDEARPRLGPLFDAVGQRTIWVGPVGTGSRLKLVANAWLALASEAVNTSLALAHRLGIDTESVISGLSGGPLVSPWQAAKLPRIAKGDYSVQFALSLALKDVHLALDAAGDEQFRALEALAEEWQDVVGLGLGEEDLTVVTRALSDAGGLPRS